MSLRTPTQYVAALKAEGCRVTAHPGWAEVNRPGPWDPTGVAVHHTGAFPTVAWMIDLLRKGRMEPGPNYLPGPLCHAGGRPSGLIDLVGWHDTNHAGPNDPRVLAAIAADQAGPAPRSPSSSYDTADGNAVLYGLELMHPGDETPWPDVQVESAVRYCTAICRLHGWSANSVVFHKSLTVRKIDPHGFPSLIAFRLRVGERLANNPLWSPGHYPVKPVTAITEETDSMTVADEVVRAMAKALADNANPLTKQLRRHMRETADAELDDEAGGRNTEGRSAS